MLKADKIIQTIPSDFNRLDFIELALLAIDQAMPAENWEESDNLEKTYQMLDSIRNSRTICKKSYKPDSSHRWLLPEWHKLDDLYFQRHTCSECGAEKTSGYCYEKPEKVLILGDEDVQR